MTKKLAACTLCLALLPSCFTVHLWGLGLEDDDHDGSYSIADGDHGPPFMEALPVRLLLTPLTILLDVCTAPVQAYLFGWEDDDDEAGKGDGADPLPRGTGPDPG